MLKDFFSFFLEGILKDFYVLAGVHDQLSLYSPHSILLMLREEFVSGDHESVHVGDTTSGS